MNSRKVKCIKTVKPPSEPVEKFSKGEIYTASLSMCDSTLHVHAVNNENNLHGIGQFSFWGLKKDAFFKEHFVFVKSS